MICKKCKEVISEVFAYCPFCGTPIATTTKKRKKRHNGAGSIEKRKGNHQRPFVAKATVAGNQIYLGTYKTKDDAQKAIDEVATKPKNDKFNVTVEEIYNEWSSAYYPTLTKSGKDGYKAAWARLSALKNKKMRTIRTEDLQTIIDNATIDRKNKTTGETISTPLSQSGKEKILQLSSQLCKKAMEYDIIDKNYSEFVALKREAPKDKRIFTDSDINKLTEDGDQISRIILTLIYSGFRINELFGIELKNVNLTEGYMVGGEKTEAGRNRVVPIHHKILPYITEWVGSAKQNQTFLLVNGAGNQISDDNFRKRDYYPKLETLGIPKRNPHTTRNTFATISRRAGMREEVLARILGHTTFSMTDRYITKDLSDLTSAMALIK